MAQLEPDMLRMLEAIAAVEPADRLPDTITAADRHVRLGPAYRNGWVTVSGWTGDGRLFAGEVLRLTPDGRAILETARDDQDAGIADATGSTVAEKKQQRRQLLEAIYDATGGSPGRSGSSIQILHLLQLPNGHWRDRVQPQGRTSSARSTTVRSPSNRTPAS